MDLKITVAGICILQVLLGVRALWVWLDSPERYSSAIAGTVLFLLSAGLWRMRAWARTLTAVFLWFLLVSVPLGFPFMLAEAGLTPRRILLWLIPAWIVTIWCVYVLQKHKGAFGKAEGAGPGGPA